MALFQSKQVILQKAIPTSLSAVDLVPVTGEFVVPAGLAAGDIIEMGGIPSRHIPVDLIVHAPDMDTGAGITLDAGVITGRFGDPVLGTRACGNEFFAASNVGQGGGVARAAKSLAGLGPTNAERGWGLKLAAGAAGLTTGGTIRATLLCEPAPLGATIA